VQKTQLPVLPNVGQCMYVCMYIYIHTHIKLSGFTKPSIYIYIYIYIYDVSRLRVNSVSLFSDTVHIANYIISHGWKMIH
jgi:hypothetical protein